MRIRSRIRGLHGFYRVYESALRYQYMISNKALHKARCLAFWEKHGLKATQDAFKTSRRTLFLWKKQFLTGGRVIMALNEKSRSPRLKRKRSWSFETLTEIKRLREEHPNLGKAKLQPLLAEFCLEKNIPVPSVATVGRLIKDLGGLRTYPKKIKLTRQAQQKRIRKPKDFKALHPGHCVALDTIVKNIWGQKRYIVTFEDLSSRFAFAWGTKSHASLAAKEFFAMCQKVFPFPLTFVLTDNGSEFAKYFSQYVSESELTHYHTYPRTPKMNAHCERFNRTLQEEFINFHAYHLLDPEKFNPLMMDYLVWYNTKRVHYAFQNKLTPVQFIQEQLTQLPQECKDGWAHTNV
ncbi:MAG: integrase core domain-containing protein [Candidatus Doudnabacteria bacterium]